MDIFLTGMAIPNLYQSKDAENASISQRYQKSRSMRDEKRKGNDLWTIGKNGSQSIKEELPHSYPPLRVKTLTAKIKTAYEFHIFNFYRVSQVL